MRPDTQHSKSQSTTHLQRIIIMMVVTGKPTLIMLVCHVILFVQSRLRSTPLRPMHRKAYDVAGTVDSFVRTKPFVS